MIVPPLSVVLSATLLSVVLFCYSGIGRLVMGPVCVGGSFRTIAAQYIVGFLAYSTVLGLAAQLRVPFHVFIPVFSGLALVGLWISARSIQRRPREFLVRAGQAAFLGILLVGAAFIPGNPTPGDLIIYALGAADIFPGVWGNTEGAGYTIGLTRGPTAALLWPLAAFGQGIGVDDVHTVGVWQLLVVVVLATDVLAGSAPLLARLLLAVAGVGMFNVTMLLIGGQINQTFGLFTMICVTWLCRYTAERRVHLSSLFFAGSVLMAGYPEFLLAVPLYFACLAVLHRTSLSALLGDGVAFLAGMLIVQLFSRFENFRYLLRQASGESRPGWAPLLSTPESAYDLWSLLLLQGASWWWLLIVVVPVGLYVREWGKRTGRIEANPRMALLAAIAIVVMIPVWSWSVLSAANVNYSAFKLAGWLGPGVFVFAWLLVQHVPKAARLGLSAAILSLALVRIVTLRDDMAVLLSEPSVAGIWVPRRVHTEQPSSNGAGCVVRPASGQQWVVARAKAESSTSIRGCEIAVSDASTVAALYKSAPPPQWKPKETRTYTVHLLNMSTKTWEHDGAAPVRLAVEFSSADGTPGQAGLIPLPRDVAPYSLVNVPVVVAAPERPGTYTLEHRVVKPPTDRSEQHLAAVVHVK